MSLLNFLKRIAPIPQAPLRAWSQKEHTLSFPVGVKLESFTIVCILDINFSFIFSRSS